MSLPSQGAWIEILFGSLRAASPSCRSLHRERGLKYAVCDHIHLDFGRSLHRERGLKLQELCDQYGRDYRRSLHRERGLKLRRLEGEALRARVAPFTGSVD